ncbi:hemagglutinin repeat-containing protein [Variovorax sp. LT2P21]
MVSVLSYKPATAATISGNNLSLDADNAVTLQSAQSASDYNYQQSASKYGVGVSAQSGMTIDLAAGSNRGTGSGSDSTNVNTYVTATNTATIKSGGNTTLAGAVVQAEAVKAEVGGDLRIQSQQDTSTATANQSGGGFDASICYFWCYGTPVVAGVEAGYFTEPGGADTVVGGGGSANTPVVFAMAGVGATGAGTAAGAAAAAGLNGASGTNQGYRDPESGRWVGGSPPLTLPSLSSLEQLAATNPVIGPIYWAYAAMWEAIGASNNVYAVPSGDPPVPGATPGRPTSGRTSQWESSGGFDQANEDFDHLNPTDVRDYGNGVRVGTLPDGRSVVVRPTSSGERRPTLEIQGPRPIKVRY